MKLPGYKGLTLLELMVVVVIISVLVLIASVLLLDAAEKARESVVRANCSAAASSLLHRFTEDADPNEIVSEVVSTLNDPNQIPDDGDEVKSPYIRSEPAFTTANTVSSGQVLIEIIDNDTISVIGFAKNINQSKPFLVKTINRL